LDGQGMGGEVEHRRRAAADGQHLEAAGGKAGGERRGQQRGGLAPVIADGQSPAAAPPGEAAEGTAEVESVGSRDRLADYAAQVVLTQHRRMKAMRRSGTAGRGIERRKQWHST